MASPNKFSDTEPVAIDPEERRKALGELAVGHKLQPLMQTVLDAELFLDNPGTEPKNLAELGGLDRRRTDKALALRALYMGEPIPLSAPKPRRGRPPKPRETPAKEVEEYIPDEFHIYGAVDLFSDGAGVVRGDSWAQLDEQYIGEHPKRGRKTLDPSDSVGMYLQEIGRAPLLNAEGEVELAKRIEAGLYADFKLKELAASGQGDSPEAEDYAQLKHEGALAKRIMLETNPRLVIGIAKGYHNGLKRSPQGETMALLDLIQEGNLGLNRAVEKFDYKKGYKFSTYATWWIRQAITRSLQDDSRLIRIPVHMGESLSKFNRVKRELTQDLGADPTLDQIAERLGIDVEKAQELYEYARLEPTSLSAPIGEDSDTPLENFVEDSRQLPVGDMVIANMMQDELRASLVKALPDERLRTIIMLRYGIGSKVHTLEEVGNVFGLTRERIRQLELRAMERLRNHDAVKQLRSYLEADVVNNV